MKFPFYAHSMFLPVTTKPVKQWFDIIGFWDFHKLSHEQNKPHEILMNLFEHDKRSHSSHWKKKKRVNSTAEKDDMLQKKH